MAVCYIGLGSNLGDRRQNIAQALKFLAEGNKIKIEKLSQLYETEPQGGLSDSPRFINAAAKISTSFSPVRLLRELKAIESRLGRKNLRRFYPRAIDLDILFYSDKRINLPFLKIPHPRLRERDFVLRPLKEIAPSAIKSLARQVRIISKITSVRKYIAGLRAKGKTIGLVPTMGALHRGHLSLVRQAKKDCDRCIVSILVNPLQFGPREDYKEYPRDLERDSILAQSAGGDLIFSPDAKDIYPENYLTYVNVEKITGYLCGKSRPGHFKGVATVVTKLFNIIQPDIAYFGQKDYQQALVIRKMVEDLNMPFKIKAMPIIRENDGLAMSSRNVYLNAQERVDAAVLYSSLQKAKEMVRQGRNDARTIKSVIKAEILKKKTAKIDYIAVADARTLEETAFIKRKTLIALAVWIGKTRLIDNIIIDQIKNVL